MIIEDLEEQGFRIGIRPQKASGKWYWVSGVNVGDNEKANWIDADNGLPWAFYNSYQEALDAAVNFCKNYKAPKLRETKSTERPRWSKVSKS